MPVRIEDIGKAVRETEYAIRGAIPARASELESQGRRIINCSIGNPQTLGQKPLTYLRQVLALCEWPELAEKVPEAFPQDVLETARRILEGSQYGLGAYSDSKGLRFVRQAVAEFIHERDGIPADPEAVYLTDGATQGINTALRILISGPNDGIMISMPQYPLYSAAITLYGGQQVHYKLDEKNGWKLSRSLLDESLAGARTKGIRVKAICVINPGNPTGSVLDAENMAMILDFAAENGLAVMADEVYQKNIYRKGAKFTSFAKVLTEKGDTRTSLFSFYSCSKGYLGECGQRGGYMETRNIPEDVAAQITKLLSLGLCANTIGQITTYLLVSPPRPGDPSWEVFNKERDITLRGLAERAALMAEGLNSIPGIECNPITGAMYAFPKITLPAGRSDQDYCMALLEKTGICMVPGSGFGQAPGTAHFRTTILPPTEQIREVVKAIAEFQKSYR
jgi:aspartate/methionine/tyrosine aminotransferase